MQLAKRNEKAGHNIMELSVNAYAKINLFLDIESVRADRYHDIISYMQTVSLHDTVTVDFVGGREKTIEIMCDDSNIPSDHRNIAYKAADIFPCNEGKIRIFIHKRIPSEAGLAGGSADAAAVLIALNRIFDNKLSLDELIELGKKLGADVPFCIKKGSCLATGTGEKLKHVIPMPKLPILIAKSGEGMSTPEAYRDLDRMFDCFRGYEPHYEMLDILISRSDLSASELATGLFNIFESVVEPKRPNVTLIKNIMNANGAAGSMMSGSGTSVFGIFDSEEKARLAQNALKDAGIAAHICYPCNSK